jgi:hypothetical protein
VTGNQLARQAETAAANYQPEQALPASVQEWRMICEQAEILSKAGDVVPRSFQGQPAKIIAAGLAGQPFGWNVMTSMRMGHVIGGGYRLNAEAQAALIRQGGHRLEITRLSDSDGASGAVVTGTRVGTGETYGATWTKQRAEGMGLWEKWSKAGTTDYMLVWRAVSEVARFLFPDLMYGMAYADGEKPDLDGAPEPEPAALPEAVAELVTADLVDGRIESKTVQAINLFGEPADPPATSAPWAEWERDDWANYIKASHIGLPDLTRGWKIRNYDDLTHADDATKAAVYDAAAPF